MEVKLEIKKFLIPVFFIYFLVKGDTYDCTYIIMNALMPHDSSVYWNYAENKYM